MYGIDILVKEHEMISKFVDHMEQVCVNILDEGKLPIAVFRAAVAFIREFADGQHHKKEEDILFQYMIDHLGEVAQHLVRNGMMVEHDLARVHNMEMEKALDEYEKNPATIHKLHVISNMMGYVYLLRRHIHKENNVAYPFAQRDLPEEILAEINAETADAVEAEQANHERLEELIEAIGFQWTV